MHKACVGVARDDVSAIAPLQGAFSCALERCRPAWSWILFERRRDTCSKGAGIELQKVACPVSVDRYGLNQ